MKKFIIEVNEPAKIKELQDEADANDQGFLHPGFIDLPSSGAIKRI